MAKHIIYLLITTIFISFLSNFHAVAELEGVSVIGQWRQKMEGVDIMELPIGSGGGLFAPELFLVRINSQKYKIRSLSAKEFDKKKLGAKRISDLSGAFLAINANFFDHKEDPLGIIISRGIQLNPIHKGGKLINGIFQVTDKSVSVIERDQFVSSGVLEAIQAGPLLISSRKPLQGIRKSDALSRRSGVCLDSKRRVIFFCSKSGIASLKELQNTLINSPVDCIEALNFDGGGSAQIYFKALRDKDSQMSYEFTSPSRDDVPVFIGVFFNQE